MFCISVRFSYWKIVVTWALVILRLSYRTISPERCIMTYLWVNLSFNCIIHLMVRLLDLTTNKIFHTAFWHLKVTQPLLCYSVNLAFVSSPSRIFISSPIGFHASPVEKLLPGLTTEKFEDFICSPVTQAVPTGLLRHCVEKLLIFLQTKEGERCGME